MWGESGRHRLPESVQSRRVLAHAARDLRICEVSTEQHMPVSMQQAERLFRTCAVAAVMHGDAFTALAEGDRRGTADTAGCSGDQCASHAHSLSRGPGDLRAQEWTREWAPCASGPSTLSTSTARV